jgi:hypothetical protein
MGRMGRQSRRNFSLKLLLIRLLQIGLKKPYPRGRGVISLLKCGGRSMTVKNPYMGADFA